MSILSKRRICSKHFTKKRKRADLNGLCQGKHTPIYFFRVPPKLVTITAILVEAVMVPDYAHKIVPFTLLTSGKNLKRLGRRQRIDKPSPTLTGKEFILNSQVNLDLTSI